MRELLIEKYTHPSYIVNIGNQDKLIWTDNYGRFHRGSDLPAVVITTGTMFWYKNGVQHRRFGPAVVHFFGTERFFLNGIELSEDEFKKHNR